MNSDTKTYVRRVITDALRPLVRILLNMGVPWKEFAEISKSVYVDLAGQEYGIKGRQTNASRVSILTGLSRREVKTQRDKLLSSERRTESKLTAAARVLSAWHRESEYLNASSKPIAIPVSGVAPSFEDLHRNHAGDVPLTALLKELETTGCVEKDADGNLRARRRYYMPAQLDSEAVERSGSVWRDIGNTLVHNLRRKSEGEAWFEGRASNDRMPAATAIEFRRYLENAAQTFLENTDNWLGAREKLDGKSSQDETVRLGVGIYTIIDNSRTVR